MASTKIVQALKSTNLPVAYSHFRTKQTPPYIVYIGNGNSPFSADDTYYEVQNTYQVELYFAEKNEAVEASVEGALVNAGFLYDKSSDAYVEELGLFMIIYTTL